MQPNVKCKYDFRETFQNRFHHFVELKLFFGRYLKNELAIVSDKIEASNAEMKQVQAKVNENQKLGDDRQKLITSLDSSLRVLRLELEELQSVEYPQDVDVEVMVSYLFLSKIVVILFTCYSLTFAFFSRCRYLFSKRKWMNKQKFWKR